MTRHDFEAWLDHHIDQPVLLERRVLDGGVIESKTSTIGVLRKETGEYRAGDSPIDLMDFEAADFAEEGVIVELGEDVELYIALSKLEPVT
jgi:hypothetical protein